MRKSLIKIEVFLVATVPIIGALLAFQWALLPDTTTFLFRIHERIDSRVTYKLPSELPIVIAIACSTTVAVNAIMVTAFWRSPNYYVVLAWTFLHELVGLGIIMSYYVEEFLYLNTSLSPPSGM